MARFALDGLPSLAVFNRDHKPVRLRVAEQVMPTGLTCWALTSSGSTYKIVNLRYAPGTEPCVDDKSNA